jgi:hypothetical protein
MKFSTMAVRVEPPANGLIRVDVTYTLDNAPQEESLPPEVMSLETLIFPAGTKNIDRLNGLTASASEISYWLAERGRSWSDWSAREYLTYRMET